MKAKAAFYFLILCRHLLSLERYGRKKAVEVKAIAELRAFYGNNIHFHAFKTKTLRIKDLAGNTVVSFNMSLLKGDERKFLENSARPSSNNSPSRA
jgi:hypothetical protein